MRVLGSYRGASSYLYGAARPPLHAAINDGQWRRDFRTADSDDNEAVEYENAVDEAAATAEAMETSGDDAPLRVEVSPLASVVSMLVRGM